MSERQAEAGALFAERLGSFFAGRGFFQLLAWTTLAVTALLIFYPIGWIVFDAFVVDGQLDVDGFLTILSDPGVHKVVGNTVAVAGSAGVLTLVVGAVFAWINERTDATSAWSRDVLPLIPLLVPQIAGVTGWVMLLSPRAGLLNVQLREIFGFDSESIIPSGPLDIFTFTGLVLVMALYLVPYVYLIVSAALRNLDPNLEEASRINGAGPFRTLWRVTLPAVKPAIFASVLILIMLGFAFFSVPIIIGTGAGIDVLSVRIYRELYNYPPRTDIAIVLSLFMMAIVQIALLMQHLVSRAGRFATIGGKGGGTSRVRLGRWRIVARLAMFLYLMATSVIPVIGLVIVSLQPFWTPNIDPSVFTLDNYRFVLFESAFTSSALVNSVLLGAVGGTIGMLVSAFLVLCGSSGRLGRTIDAVTALPAAFPHTVLGVGFLVTFSQGWLNIHGTLTLLLVTYLVMYLPQSQRSASSALAQVGRELVEASHVFRASTLRTFRRIVIPLMIPGLVAGWVILFVQMAGEITASALLSGPSNPVVGLVLLDLWENGSFPQLTAMAVIMTVLDAVVVLAVLRYFRGAFRS